MPKFCLNGFPQLNFQNVKTEYRKSMNRPLISYHIHIVFQFSLTKMLSLSCGIRGFLIYKSFPITVLSLLRAQGALAKSDYYTQNNN